jgi:hypothetical protein
MAAQQGMYAAFSARVTQVIGFEIELNLGSYITPTDGDPYWSRGVGVVLEIGRLKLGGSYEALSYNGGFSFKASPSNFILGSFEASRNGVSLVWQPPQAISGFQLQLDNPQSLLPTRDTPYGP